MYEGFKGLFVTGTRGIEFQIKIFMALYHLKHVL